MFALCCSVCCSLVVCCYYVLLLVVVRWLFSCCFSFLFFFVSKKSFPHVQTPLAHPYIVPGGAYRLLLLLITSASPLKGFPLYVGSSPTLRCTEKSKKKTTLSWVALYITLNRTGRSHPTLCHPTL